VKATKTQPDAMLIPARDFHAEVGFIAKTKAAQFCHETLRNLCSPAIMIKTLNLDAN